MPLTARTADGKVVYADMYRAEVAIFCRDCGDPMHYRRYVDDPPRVEHFAHNPRGAASGPRACSSETTPEHDNAKATLLLAAPAAFDALAGALGKYEQDVTIPDEPPRLRRADVLFLSAEGRYPVAFEAQFSKIAFAANGSGRSVAERTADYHAAGVHVVWCFPGKRTAQEHIAAARREYGCVGVLSPDGMEVEFRGVNALWLNKHPQRAAIERAQWRERQARPVLRAAAGAYAPRPAPAARLSVTDEQIERYFAQANPASPIVPQWDSTTPNVWREGDVTLPPGWRLVQCDHKGNPSRYGDYWYAEGPGGHTDIHRYPDSAAFWARRFVQEHS